MITNNYGPKRPISFSSDNHFSSQYNSPEDGLILNIGDGEQKLTCVK